MKQYIGTKIVKAEPMTRGDYNNYRGWQIPADEDPMDEGYLMEYENGHEQWLPKEMFETDYIKCDTMPFGFAIEAMKREKGDKKRLEWKRYVFIQISKSRLPDVQAVHRKRHQ